VLEAEKNRMLEGATKTREPEWKVKLAEYRKQMAEREEESRKQAEKE